MTIRLIGLMSILLFLSLLAFMLLLRRSEDAILKEVERTVSTVGVETMRAFAQRISPGEGTWMLALRDDAAAAPADGGAAAGPSGEEAATSPPEGSQRVRMRRTLDGVEAEFEEFIWSADGGPPSREELERCRQTLIRLAQDADSKGKAPAQLVLPAMPVHVRSVGEHEVRVDLEVNFVAAWGPMAPGAGLPVPPDLPPGAPPRPQPEAAFDADATARVLVMSEPGEDPADAFSLGLPLEGAAAAPMLFTHGPLKDRLMFHMSTRHYGALFEALRERMWVLFGGVLAVGTLLAAAVARRFTRPIRELDGALRRVAKDDLDVQVRVASGGGEVTRLTHAFNDMARRLRASRERSRELTRRERLSALGRLAAGVAHDVRNPLHSINLSLQHMQDTCPPQPHAAAEFDRTLGLIRGEVRRLDALVSNFLRFARGGKGGRTATIMVDLLRQTAAVVAKEAAARRIEVQVEVEPEVPVLEVQAESLRSALLNLVLNSFEAMPGGGTVTLRARRHGDGALLEVVDTGVGIPAAHREQVFDFGFTTRENGHGLGLAMVHQIVVEEHGGRVELDSAPGRGTVLRMELPAAAAFAGAAG